MRKKTLMRSKDFFCKVVMTAFMLLWTTSICAKTVTGKVLSASDNEPLLGATVIVQGKQGGSVTDLDGNLYRGQ